MKKRLLSILLSVLMIVGMLPMAAFATTPGPDGVQLWENGPYFAECNVGASKPEEYGYYFWWGDSVGYQYDESNHSWVSVDGEENSIEFKSSDSTANRTYRKSAAELKTAGFVDDETNPVLKAANDAAAAHMGGSWRMPTKSELESLCSNCTLTWTDDWNSTGVKGTIVTGKNTGYTDRSIFLPAAGFGNNYSLYYAGSDGFYWSSEPSETESNYMSIENGMVDTLDRCYGLPVRAVQDAPVPQSNWKKLSDAMAWTNPADAATELTVTDNSNPAAPIFTVKDETVSDVTTRIITLLADITADVSAGSTDTMLVVPKGKNVTLDLNGFTLDRGLKEKDAVKDGIAITTNGNLTLNDNSDAKTGKITGCRTNYVERGSLLVSSTGSCVMNGGSFADNQSADGGGVYIDGGAFTMTGGRINDNKAIGSYGGGVYIDGGVFTMTGGEITGNTTDKNMGGGVYIASGTFTMTGGEISGNASTQYGGGVFVCKDSSATFNGTAVVRNNSGSTAESNIHLQSNWPITLSADGFQDGAEIGVTVWESSGWDVGTNAEKYFGSPTTLTDANCGYVFINNSGSSNTGTVYKIAKPATNFVLIGAYTVTGYSGEGGTVTPAKSSYTSGETVTLTVAPDEGCRLKADSLKATYTDGEGQKQTITPVQDAQDTAKYTFAIPAADVTVTAEFEEDSTVVLPEGAAWIDGTGTIPVWYKLTENMPATDPATYTLTIGGEGEIGSLDAVANKDQITAINISDATVTGAGNGSFAGIGFASLSLPDGWLGELPDEDGNWYGAVTNLMNVPYTVKNVAFLQRYPWNGYVDITADVIGAGEIAVSVSICTKPKGWFRIGSPSIMGDAVIDLGDGETGSLAFVWNASKDLNNELLNDIKVEVALDGKDVSSSVEGKVDLRTSIALPEGETTVEDATWSDTAWNSVAPAGVTIGWKNMNTSETGVLVEGLTGNGINDFELPEKDGEYRLTHSIAGLESFVTYVVTGYPAYTVTDGTAAGANGSISFDKTTATETETVTVTVTPDPGYQLSSLNWAPTDNLASPTDITAAKSFAMPAGNVTVTAEFVEIPAAPAEGEGYTVDYAAETITVEDGYEISTKNGTASGDTFEDGKLTPDGNGQVSVEPGGTYYVRKAASGSVPASEATGFMLNTRQAIPETPVLVSKTETTITVEAPDGQEYSIDGGTTWVTGTDGKVTFTGLTASTGYSIVRRMAATGSAFASYSSDPLTVTTNSTEPAPGPTPGPTPVDPTPTTDPEDEPKTNDFDDVKEDDYFYDAVRWAAENGITEGVDETHFDPKSPIRRAEVVTFLWRAAGCPVVNHIMTFEDVASGDYYTEAVRWALALGITEGVDETHFDPNSLCNRAQIVTFLARFAGVQDANAGLTFDDVKDTDYFAAAVKWAKENGVTEGTSETTFSPKDDCKRADAVTFLYRWIVR